MAGNEANGKFFEAVNANSDAVIDAIRGANDRGHRITAALIEEAQEGQREAVQLARKWAAAPMDIPGFFSAIVESGTKAQGRALEVGRQFFSEMGEAQRETRDLFTKMFQANREMGEAGAEFARGVTGRAGEAVQSVTSRANEAAKSVASSAEADGRRAVREAARSVESSAE
jgi:hypothetical protein